MTIPNIRPPTSSEVSRKRPATSPTITPTTSATIIAKNVSSSVAAPFVRMMSLTGRWSVIVVPKSPRRMFQRYSKYCWYSGLSKPSRCLIWSITDWGTLCPPSAAEIGSPGATRISRNTNVSRIRTIGTTSTIRVSRYDLSDVPWATAAMSLRG